MGISKFSKKTCSRRRSKGILLITTLLIMGFLTALTVGFVFINRDNLYFAAQTNGGQTALEAAYAGLNYAMMRFEQDANFGIDPQAAGQPNADNNPFVGQYDAFPDGRPGGAGGNYWGGGGVAIPYQRNYLTVYETGQTVVGVLSNGASHFQIHFAHYPGTNCPANNGPAANYSTNGFNDSSIQGQPFANWRHMQMPADMHSLNNLNNGSSVKDPAGKIVPAYSAHIISIGYSNGVTRVAEALLKNVFYANSTITSAHDITMRVLSAPTYGNGNIYFGSLAPLINNIQAGALYNSSTDTFQISGGNLDFYADYNNSLSKSNVSFSTNSANTRYQGSGYALMLPGSLMTDTSTGTVQLDQQYPNANGVTSVAVGSSNSGMLYAKAGQSQPLPTKDLQASDIFANMGVSTTTGSNGLTVPASSGSYNPTNAQGPNGMLIQQSNGSYQSYYIPGGTWAFRDQGTAPNTVDVYSDSGSGTVIATFNPSVISGLPTVQVTINGTTKSIPIFNIKNYKLIVAPGVNLVVDDSIQSATVNTAGSAQGNMFVTLSPKDFNSGDPNTAPSNLDSLGHYVLPTVGLGYANASTLGSAPSSLTLGGNLYVQGSVVGQGSVVAQTNTTAPSNWVPSTGDWSGNPWAGWIISNGSQNPPTAGAQADVYVEANSELSKAPNASVNVYSQGNVSLNPIPAGGSSNNSLDAAAMKNALNNFAGGGGYWNTNNLPAPVSDTLNNWLSWSGNSNNTTTVLRCATSCTAGSLEYADTGETALNLFGSSTTNTNLINYLANNIPGSGCTAGQSSCSITGGELNLYQYKVLSNYQSTNDTDWLSYTAPPSSGSSLDAVESSIVSGVNSYAQQAYATNQPLASYIAGSDPANYQKQDMVFQGTIYAKGSTGFQANTSNYRFSLQGALVATQGYVEVDNAGQINFLFDPSRLSSFYQLINGGTKVTLQWVTIW